ncbi:unnamed protein product [Sphenostylis stenocarpa]|uniref:Uncharacterized protein n=1 Tax=Sphenostylis stenocarpa TaxID=92480 RepID=A0AA86RRD4_9FABA|nr:unnamed protein product [Sphenostylis stenocarpa]
MTKSEDAVKQQILICYYELRKEKILYGRVCYSALANHRGWSRDIIVSGSYMQWSRLYERWSRLYRRWSRAVHASGHEAVQPTSRVHSKAKQSYSVVGWIFAAAINFGVTLVGTFVFGILSEEHPGYGYVSSRHVLPRNRVAGLKTSTFHLDNAKF